MFGPQGGSGSVQHGHTHPGCLLVCSDKSHIFAAGLRSLVQLLEPIPDFLSVPGLKARIVCECLPIVPDLWTRLGDPEAQSHPHGHHTVVRTHRAEQTVWFSIKDGVPPFSPHKYIVQLAPHTCGSILQGPSLALPFLEQGVRCQ